ncbi:hypothetical protein [Niastella sp. OAS944]|uniref:hypothetical protein n=1 Tax=Niastella sp. OAS944 TaxID=2664089 RepID=UPI00348CE4E6|nr:hypothetical protein [Chitinophagaceae bacterium OAS944]
MLVLKSGEIVRRTGISRNTVRKYLQSIENNNIPSELQLTHKVYCSDVYEHDLQRYTQLQLYFNQSASELSKTGVIDQASGEQLPAKYLLPYFLKVDYFFVRRFTHCKRHRLLIVLTAC